MSDLKKGDRVRVCDGLWPNAIILWAAEEEDKYGRYLFRIKLDTPLSDNTEYLMSDSDIEIIIIH